MTDHLSSTPGSQELSPYELIFRATNDVLYDVNLVSGTVLWNDALYTQYGYDRSIRNDTVEWWIRHIHPDDALEVEQKVTEWFESDRDSWQAEYRFAKVDNTYKYVRDRGYVIRDKQGKPVRIIGSLLDITQQTELDKAKDEFISLVSHQLRTPLTVIRTYGELLSAGTFGRLTPGQKKETMRITAASVDLINLVGDILDISKIELQRSSLAPVKTNLCKLVTRHIAEVMPLATQKAVTIGFLPCKPEPSVMIDRTVVGQILHNYLTNAIRYTLPGEGRIIVSLSSEGNGYTLSVQDNGIGIPKSAQAQIFDRFYRANNAENIEAHGTGLGLYLVSLLAKKSGGKVWFDSVEHERTTFYYWWPKSIDKQLL